MSKLTELNLIVFILGFMDQCKDSPDREKFCVNFDEAYTREKARYKELTSEDWGASQ